MCTCTLVFSTRVLSVVLYVLYLHLLRLSDCFLFFKSDFVHTGIYLSLISIYSSLKSAFRFGQINYETRRYLYCLYCTSSLSRNLICHLIFLQIILRVVVQCACLTISLFSHISIRAIAESVNTPSRLILDSL